MGRYDHYADQTALWRDLRAKFRDRAHLQRVENACGFGDPDVNGCLLGGPDFNLELKVAETPARGGLVRVETLTRQQKLWHRTRGLSGGRAFLLLRLGQGEHLLFDWRGTMRLGTTDLETTRAMSRRRSEGGLDPSALEEAIRTCV